jgi:hypothetical protein
MFQPINRSLILLIAFLFACDDGDADQSTTNTDATFSDMAVQDLAIADMRMLDVCAQPIAYLYDPLNEELATEFHTFPDDLFTKVDESTNSKQKNQLHLSPWYQKTTPFMKNMVEQIDQLDGWGLNAGIVIKFKGKLANIPTQINADDPLFKLIRLDEEQEHLDLYPAQVPMLLEKAQEDQALILNPMLPLKPNTLYGLIISREWKFEDQCFTPSDFLSSILDQSADIDQKDILFAKYQKLLNISGLKKEEVAVATVFTTQSALLDSLAVADHIKTQSYAWEDDAQCSDEGDYIKCMRSFTANDYRTDGILKGALPQSQYKIPVYAWLPKSEDPNEKFPVIVYGHGIGGDSDAGWSVFANLKTQRVAVVGIDAQKHGIHPTANPQGTSFNKVMDFFAMNVQALTLEALKARDNFRGSTFDKLQLVELLFQDGDLNDDGIAEINANQLGYYGLSLGGIMGVELLALEDRIQTALLTVPGANLAKVVSKGEIVRPFMTVFYGLVGGQKYFEASMSIAQVLLDAADPGTFAPWVQLNRLANRVAKPNVLQQMAMNDQTVPNVSNAALARAFRYPHLKPVSQSIGVIEEVDGPLKNNIDANTSGAIFQFAVISESPSRRNIPSDHTNVPYSVEAENQYRHFFKTWLSGEGAEIINPYE